MQLHSHPSGPAGRRAAAMTVTAVLAVTLAACSSSGSTATHTKHGAAAPSSAGPAASTPVSAAAASASALSGTWHGRYGGAYQGTFVLHWRQSGANLSGHIHISDPPGTMPIHGKLAGGSIRFGTVGRYAISYTGTVSGSSMSGHWQLNGRGTGGGWSASQG